MSSNVLPSVFRFDIVNNGGGRHHQSNKKMAGDLK